MVVPNRRGGLCESKISVEDFHVPSQALGLIKITRRACLGIIAIYSVSLSTLENDDLVAFLTCAVLLNFYASPQKSANFP